MSALRTGRAFFAIAASLLALTLFASCGDGDEEIEPTATVEAPTATAEEPIHTPDTSLVSEAGEAPIFWRTVDEFASLRADEPYKVLFRITSGYEEETLLIVAEREEDGLRVEFKALRSKPQGEEPPGSYYPLTLGLPEPGAWQLTVVAGDDQATIPVEVAPAES